MGSNMSQCEIKLSNSEVHEIWRLELGHDGCEGYFYTIQLQLSKAGTLGSHLFNCFREPTGKGFGPQVQKQLSEVLSIRRNVKVTCSKSGKRTTPLLQEWFTVHRRVFPRSEGRVVSTYYLLFQPLRSRYPCPGWRGGRAGSNTSSREILLFSDIQ